MFKRFLALFLLLSALPVSAGALEDAMKTKDYVFLYLYTSDCGYCKKFNPIYNKLSKMYDKDYAFVKIDASTLYGHNLMRSFNSYYVPFVALIKSKNKQAAQVNPNCLLAMSCAEKAITGYKK